MRPNETIGKIDSLVEIITHSLYRYSKRPNAKPGYIKSQNEILMALESIRSDLTNTANPALWTAVEAQIDYLKNAEPDIDGFIIVISNKGMPSRPRIIQIPYLL